MRLAEDLQVSLPLLFVQGELHFDSAEKLSFSSFNKVAHKELTVNIGSKSKRGTVINKSSLKSSLST